MHLLALALLAAAPVPGAGESARPEEAVRLIEARLKEAFGHCQGASVHADPVLQLKLPTTCRLAGGRSASGVLQFEFLPLAAAGAPTLDRASRLRVSAAPFSLDGLQLEGVLLEARLTDDARELVLLPRTAGVRTRALAPGPGRRWVEARPPRDRALDPLGDAARDFVNLMAATPVIVAGVGQELARLAHDGAVANAPELVALWALTVAPPPADAGQNPR